MICGASDTTMTPRGRSASRRPTAIVATAFPVTRERTTCPVNGSADATEALKFMDWDPRMSVCGYEGLVLTGNDMIKAGSIKMDKPFQAGDFYDDTVSQRIIRKHPQMFSDLPPLPRTVAECKGKLS